MSLQPGEAEILFQFEVPQTLPAATRDSALLALAGKLGRMDTTNIRGGWSFNIGSNDPTPAEAVAKANEYLPLLVGDEAAVANPIAPSSDFIYCIFDDIRVCYQSIALHREVANTDTAWGGKNGANSRIAWHSAGVILPLNVVFRFARLL